MNAHALVVRRMRLAVEAPAGRGDAVARGALQAARDLLPQRLAGGFGDADSAAPDSVVLIRRLELDLTAPLDSGADHLARLLADAILAGIGKAVAQKAACLRFRSHAAYVAAFLQALLSGTAWNAWWFRSFDGVRALPLSAAIRTVLERDWSSTPTVLSALDESARVRLAHVLTDRDADVILDALAVQDSGPGSDQLWSVIAEALLNFPAGIDGSRAAINIVMAIAAAHPEMASGWIVRLARSLVPLATALAHPSERERVITVLRNAETERDTDAVSWLSVARKQLPRALLVHLKAGPAGSTERAPAAWRWTPLGGYGLLLPSLFNLDLEAATKDWPQPPFGASGSALIRFLVLATAGGPVGAMLAEDPVWRDVFCLPARLGPAAIADWSQSLGSTRWRSLDDSAEQDSDAQFPVPLVPGRCARAALAGLARHVLRCFVQRLPGFAAATPAFVRANLLCRGAMTLLDESTIRFRIERPPLDVLLSITGVADLQLQLADGRLLHVERLG